MTREELKEFIQANKPKTGFKEKQLKKYHPDVYGAILSETAFLRGDDLIFKERVVCIEYGVFEQKTCETCTKPTRMFANYGKLARKGNVHQRFCSVECRAKRPGHGSEGGIAMKTKLQDPEFKAARDVNIEATSIARYGAANVMQTEHGKSKIRKEKMTVEMRAAKFITVTNENGTKTISYDGYLTEKIAIEILIEVFGTQNVRPQYSISVDDKRYRVDALIYFESQKFMFEFDGMYHYISAVNQYRDERLEDWCKKNDFVMKRIPYFIQLDNETFSELFGVDVANIVLAKTVIMNNFAHGYIHEKCTLPADYNEVGYERFLSDCNTYKSAIGAVKSSIENWFQRTKLPKEYLIGRKRQENIFLY